MEDRFITWLKLCREQKTLGKDEIEGVKRGDKKLAEDLFKEFCQFDEWALQNFVQDCMIEAFAKKGN